MTSNDEYRSKMDPAMEMLSYVLQDIGADVDGVQDNVLVEMATRKLRMLYEIATQIAGVNPELIKIAMRG